MFKLKHICAALAALFMIFSANVPGVCAQSTIFNIPSTDVVAKKQLYVETNFTAHFDSYQNNGFHSYGVLSVYGVSKNVEVGVNAFYTEIGTGSLPVEIQPNIKWQAYNNEKHGVAISTGAMLFHPITHVKSGDLQALVYSNASKKVNKLNGARLTGGAYTTIGARSGSGTRSGAIFGYEQPIAKRVLFTADWFTGNNRFGYAVAGVGLTLSPKDVLYAGYNFGNAGRGNNFLSLSYGRSF